MARRTRPPNIYAWQIGEVPCTSQSSAYSVVVGMTARAGTNQSTSATIEAIQLWQPRYILFAGIAGGLSKIITGDVVIADTIYGYEYGKIDQGFMPRPNWTYRTDQGLLTGASAYASKPDWRSYIQLTAPVEKCKSQTVIGEIASGDKVVDNPDDEFFKRVLDAYPKVKAVEMEGAGVGHAIDQAQARGKVVGFLMIRGISDVPPDGTQERDEWKAYAADVAAAFAVGYIADGLPTPPLQQEETHITSNPLQKPRHVEHFIGREEELESVLKDLKPGSIVTLCGPGGMGKTALATEAIWQLAPGNEPPERFPDGIIFHTFYHQPKAAIALEAIARDYGEDPLPNPAEAARRALSSRRALLVLDGSETADNLKAVLDIAGNCGVLITTRRHGDAPADLLDLEPLSLEHSVQLLQAWGGDWAADETASLRICELLGGLPLAIFLAGRYMAHQHQLAANYLTWLEATPLAALDMGDRQHESIPLLIENSLANVSELSQAALGIARMLALEAFDPQLIAVALEIENANRSLGKLVDYGLMQRPDARYQVTHALLHAYARERLAPNHETLFRLAEHFNAYAREQSELDLPGYACLDLLRTHILAVQSACLAAEEWSSVRQLTWAIENYLDLQGHWTERVAIGEMGLKAARADGSRYDEGAFLNSLGLAYAALGETRKAIEFYEQHLAIAREIGDRKGEGNALGSLGTAYDDFGETHKAIEFYEQALAIDREIGDRRGEGNALWNMSLSLDELSKRTEAIENASAALVIYEQIESPNAESVRRKLAEWQG